MEKRGEREGRKKGRKEARKEGGWRRGGGGEGKGGGLISNIHMNRPIGLLLLHGACTARVFTRPDSA